MATQNSLNKTSGGFTSTGGLANTAGIVAINSTTSACGISTDASATTVLIATGGAVKTVTLGSTNTTSSTIIKSGTGNIAMNSGLTVDSTGRMTNAMQPMFLVGRNADIANITGNNTLYTIPWDTELYDIGSNFAASTFTAPVTGKYLLSTNLTAIYSAGYLYAIVGIYTTSSTYTFNFGPLPGGGVTNLTQNVSAIANMTAGDTAVVKMFWGNAAKTVGVQGNTGAGSVTTYFYGALLA